MKKLLLCTPIYPPEIGGPATYTKEICERLKDEYEISILTYANKSSAQEIQGCKLYIVNNAFKMPIRLAIYTFKLFWLAKKTDYIYVQNAVASGFPVLLISRILKIKYILKFVGDEAWERATQSNQTTLTLEEFQEKKNEIQLSLWIKCLIFVQKITLQGATIVTTPSIYLGESLIKNYGVKSETVKVNYNASDEENNFNLSDLKKNERQIIVTARLTKWKGIDNVILAINSLKEKYESIKLVICGDGPELENLRKLTSELNLNENVIFKGRVSREETFRLRKESAVYILNSSYEGLPHTALTSFQAGIPIIATNIPGTNEAVYDYESGLLVEPNNSKMLSEKIIELFENKNLQDKLVKGGTKILKEKFSWESHLKLLKTFFN